MPNKNKNKIPYQFSNEKKDGKHILTLSGTIRKRYWRDDDVIDAKSIRDALDGVEDDVVIKLNSPGGDVFQGVEIYNYLKDHSSNITVEVTGEAASAATFIVAGADEVIMNIGTSLMIHEAATMAWGNKKDIQKVLNALDTIDESIVSIYVEKTGQTNQQIIDWMDEQKYFNADDAVKYGFANSVKRKQEEQPADDSVDIAAMIQSAVASAMTEFSATQEGNKEPQRIETPKAKSLLERMRKGDK